MPAPAPRPDRDWCDVEGTHKVEDIPEPGALPSRLHQQGRVLGRGLDTLYIRFPDNALVSPPPYLLRLVPDTPSEG